MQRNRGQTERSWVRERMKRLVATQCSQFLSCMKKSEFWAECCMICSLGMWTPRGALRLFMGHFHFLTPIFLFISPSLVLGLCFKMINNYAFSPFYTFTISLFHNSFSLPFFFFALLNGPCLFPGLLFTSPTSFHLFSPLPRGSVCKCAEEKNEGTNYETLECIPYLV